MKEVINTSKAPQAIGPYSQAIKVNGFLFVSGQIGINPQTGELVPGGVEAQIKQAMENIRQILSAAGMEFSHVVKTTIFITNMDDFTAVNKIYSEYFGKVFPARSCIAVASLPKGALVEVEVVACK
ncbi:RidA family protein [Carboxydothermus ferrireducens]|uniref:2-iminobutanoate/2-iminopropanoate deaminase n=1 Tax=Carboxydothermus ferrireducens DSM 11255 TaxID=1119529 RepID=A0ABX2R9F5_9THEO|nr:RidA family protein [Carboxydothermus ferrireducens]NYE57811.1 2-iminobutanoate/2-iminopropanoate deaminase [Carboxydothermus ferrireducens DSM 11255]